jgi:tetratricopeptide (TPR) repeat protein
LASFKKNLKRIWDSATEDYVRVFEEALISGFMGDYEEALELFDRCDYLNVGLNDRIKKDTQFYRSNALSELGKIDEAILEWKKYLDMEKNDSAAWNNLGVEYSNLENYDKALECFEKAITIEPDEEIFWTGKAEAYFELEQYDEFEKATTKALELNPASHDALVNKTMVLWQNDKNEEAIKNEERLVELEPDNWAHWNALGTSYETVKNYEKALECFEKGITVDSTEDLLWFNRACMLSRLNKKDEALDSIHVAISLNPENLVDLKDEDDFENLKETERFKKFLMIPF